MELKLYSNIIEDYLAESDVLDFSNQEIKNVADKLYKSAKSETEYIKAAFEFVRDEIHHSADINNNAITYIASDVLKEKHGICFSKSHLLAALLRCKSVPTGLCYQKITLEVKNSTTLVYHGLNGVYLKEFGKWIRLDPRGNVGGIDAQFLIDGEKLAYPIDTKIGEEDNHIIYPLPDKNVVERLREYKLRTELWDDLPDELFYK